VRRLQGSPQEAEAARVAEPQAEAVDLHEAAPALDAASRHREVLLVPSPVEEAVQRIVNRFASLVTSGWTIDPCHCGAACCIGWRPRRCCPHGARPEACPACRTEMP
jgi:hypothetical protein